MRFFRVLPALTLLLGARASSLDSREPTPHRLDTRELLDVCVSINAQLVVPNALNILTAVGVLDVCLCLSAVPLFLESNIVAQLAVDIAGVTAVNNALTALINENAPSSKCVYPEHSKPACIDGNPCGFTCVDGFTPSPFYHPTTCVCNAPSVICNGQCGPAGACPSSVAHVKKRSWVGSGACSEMGPGWVACGILGGGPRSWECVNAARDLESCGGCMFPLTAYSPIGRDCSTLPGVADVSCLGGECIVDRCQPGYVPAFDGTSCIRKYHLSQSQFSDPGDVPASAYGLEHVPLARN